jgi:TolA-binding protein
VKAAGAAREVYEGFRTAFPTHPLRATAEYERANCYALAGDAASALTKLPRFHAEPFVKSPIAPIAMLREAQILRSLNRFPEAAAVMAQARQLHEETLKKDDARAAWVPLLRYHHGVCHREAKQNAEAIKIFQSVVAEYPSSEWAKSSKEMLEETK